MMNWTRTATIGLAKGSCAQCNGYGLRRIREERALVPCGCVFRAIFRACYNRFRYCATPERHMSTVTLDLCRGRDRNRSYGRRAEEYLADFCLVSERSLEPDEHRLFRYHFLLGADWKLCCRFLNLDRGTFFHRIYKIEQKLGRIFAELDPYALYPVDEYFGCAIRKEAARAAIGELPPPRKRLRVPLKRIA